MVTSSLSLLISFRCSCSLWHPIGILTRFLLPCYVFNINQWLWCYDLSIKIDVLWGRNNSWKLFNQAFKFFFFSKISQLNIELTFLKSHFLKQLTIVSSETSPQADFIQEIAFKTLNSWIMSVDLTLLLILEIMNFKSFLRYLSLNFLMIPPSNNWSLEVVFFWQKHDFDVGILLA